VHQVPRSTLVRPGRRLSTSVDDAIHGAAYQESNIDVLATSRVFRPDIDPMSAYGASTTSVRPHLQVPFHSSPTCQTLTSTTWNGKSSDGRTSCVRHDATRKSKDPQDIIKPLRGLASFLPSGPSSRNIQLACRT
jgi:hypothetical protein